MGIGVYIHIPYCESKCLYCDFHSLAETNPPWRALLDAIRNELQARSKFFRNSSLSSIYFGGGSPSLAPTWFVNELIENIHETFAPISNLEISLEVNPNHTALERFQAWRRVGINRISLGVQSWQDNVLCYLGRVHSAQDNKLALLWALQAGFNNTSLDLICAVPGQSLKDWQADVNCTLQAQPQHISIYALTYYPHTPLTKQMQKGNVQQLSEEQERQCLDLIHEKLTIAGYEHYEVSNFAEPGFRAIHNSLYWTGADYLGIGPGAHSFRQHHWQKGFRWTSIKDPNTYIQAWKKPHILAFDEVHSSYTERFEILNAEQLYDERILCGFRYSDGISLNEPVIQIFRKRFEKAIPLATKNGWLYCAQDRFKPTWLGLLFHESLVRLFCC